MMLCARFGWHCPIGSRKRRFISSMYFGYKYFVIISPWIRMRPHIFINFNLPYPRILFAKFSWNWPIGSREEDFIIISHFVNISPWKGRGPSFQQTWIFITQGVAKFVGFLIGSSVLETKIFKFRQCTFPSLLSSPLGNGRGPSFEQTWIPFTQGCNVPILVEIIGLVVQTTTDNGQILIGKGNLSLRLRWAKNIKRYSEFVKRGINISPLACLPILLFVNLIDVIRWLK